MIYYSRLSLLVLVFASAFTAPAQAAETVKNRVVISDAWVRTTNPGQEVGAAYMTLNSSEDATLVKIESDATKSIEIHSMSMQNGVMKMRMLDKLSLSTNKPYKLAPGGFHLMLFDLKKPLLEGEELNLTLSFKDKNNVMFYQKIKAPVRSMAVETGDVESHEHHHH